MDEGKSEKGISRRGFLKGTAVGVGAGVLAGFPLKEVKAQGLEWDKETDVLIVGSGFAGMAAAIEAYEAGASVTILEKMPTYGGNSIIAVGAYNTVDPPRQAAQGIRDSIDLHFEQTLAGGDFRADPAKVRYLVENALDGWQWLEKIGVKLAGPIFQIYGALWPRTHAPIYKEKRMGAAIIAALYDEVQARRIPLLLEHKVTNILRSQPLKGRILGVEAEAEGRKLNFKARRGVILASGGFCANVEVRMRYDPRFTDRFGTSNHAGATGETLMMGADVGGDIVGIDFIQSLGPAGPDARYVTPPVGFVRILENPMIVAGGLWVNYGIYTDLRGKRIVATDARRDQITEATMRTPEKVCVGIFDVVSEAESIKSGIPMQMKEEMLKKRPKEMFRADTLLELAKKVGMPDPTGLEETVKRYNSFVDTKNDADFGQLPINLIWKCQKPPFWAATGSPALHHMCGGLRTKGTSTHVLDRWNEEMPALFAAGEITGGVHGANRLGGNATTDCIVFGRLAGKEAALQSPWS